MILHTLAVGALATAIGAIGIAPVGSADDTSTVSASRLMQPVARVDQNVSVWEYTMKAGGKISVTGNVFKPGGALLNVVSINGELHSVNGPGLVPGMKFESGSATGVWKLHGTISEIGEYGFYVQRSDHDLADGQKAVVLVRINVTKRAEPAPAEPAPTPKPAPSEDLSHLEPNYGPDGIEGGTPWL